MNLISKSKAMVSPSTRKSINLSLYPSFTSFSSIGQSVHPSCTNDKGKIQRHQLLTANGAYNATPKFVTFEKWTGWILDQVNLTYVLHCLGEDVRYCSIYRYFSTKGVCVPGCCAREEEIDLRSVRLIPILNHAKRFIYT